MGISTRLAAGETLYSAWSGIPDALTLEALARTGFDAVTLDMQHGAHHEDSVARGLAPILSAGKPALVRIPVGRFDMASRALDFGADAVIAPMVNSPADARAFAAAMKYPPLGERSWGPSLALPRSGKSDSRKWLAEANGATLALAMIETRAAYEAREEIIAVEGIDGVLVGPSDFSIAWSRGAVVDPSLPEMMEAISAIAESATRAGKHAAIYVGNPELVGRYLAMGFRLIALGNEQRYMALGAASLIDMAKAS